MREPDNIRAVAKLGIDLMGFIFAPKSPRYADADFSLMRYLVGHPELLPRNGNPERVGVFVNEEINEIKWAVIYYQLGYVQLHGNEDRAYIEELRSVLGSIMNLDVKIIKALSVESEDDVKRWRGYDGVVDILLFDTKGKAPGGNGTQFDWSVLNAYDGGIPFLLSGGIGPDDADRVLSFRHEMCIGIDLNSRFETAPGVKNADSLRTFIDKIRNNENIK